MATTTIAPHESWRKVGFCVNCQEKVTFPHMQVEAHYVRPAKFTSADSNRAVLVNWIPGEEARRGRLTNWYDWNEKGEEFVTVWFEDSDSTSKVNARKVRRHVPQS